MDLLKRFKKAPAAPIEEVTIVGSRYLKDMMAYTNFDSEVDDALAKHGYSLYVKEMMADDQVKACMQIKKLGVTVGGHAVLPAVGEGEAEYEQAQEIADFVDWCLKEMTGSVDSVLMNTAHALVPGFSVQEIIWKELDKEPYAGKIGIDCVKLRPSESFTFDIDFHGNINQLIQTVDGQKINVPLEKVLLFTYDPQQTGRPQGVSDLRAAYSHWWAKKGQMKWRQVAAEKFAAPTVVGKYPPGTSKSAQQELLNVLKTFATDTAIVVPVGVEVELLQAGGSVMLPYTEAIDSCNKGIARAIFGQVLATDEGKTGTGSYAQAKIHKGILGMFLDGLRESVAETVLYEQLVKRLVDYNYDTHLYPKIKLAPPDERDLTALAGVMDVLLKNGVVLKQEPFIRQEFGFPPIPQDLAEALMQLPPSPVGENDPVGSVRVEERPSEASETPVEADDNAKMSNAILYRGTTL